MKRRVQRTPEADLGSSAAPARPEREAQALREVGVTAIRRRAAATLVLLFLATIGGVAPWQLVASGAVGEAGNEAPAVVAAFARDLAGLPALARREGLLGANRRLLETLHGLETGLEEGSPLRALLLPPVQLWMLRRLGTGNEQVYPGRDGWLFYRADVDYVTGPPFLDRRVLERRASAGEAWQPAPHPDPLPVLLALHQQLAERDVELVILPVPVKPSIEGGELSRRRPGNRHEVVQNPSYGPFLDQLVERGVAVWDPAATIMALAPENERYLRTDTHWTPAAVDRVARELALWLEARGRLRAVSGAPWVRRRVAVEGRGDLLAMLTLPALAEPYPLERVELQRVLTAGGRSWTPDPDAEVLVLGDSFTNIYSDPSLGFGSGAGLAEQLAYHLQRPVDRLAQNAGGAWAARQAFLERIAATGRGLEGRKFVVYEFAARELSGGDWRPAPLDTQPGRSIPVP